MEDSTDRCTTPPVDLDEGPIAEAWLFNEKRTAASSWTALQSLREVDSKMRSVLVDWLFEVVEQYSLSRRTLALAANYVDRYLSVVPSVRKGKLQLLGATCLFVASKFDDLSPVDLAALCWISDHAYSGEEVIEQERLVLQHLRYELCHVPCCTFLDALMQALPAVLRFHEQFFYLCNFLCDAAMLSWQVLRAARPSQLVMSFVYVCMFSFYLNPPFQKGCRDYGSLCYSPSTRHFSSDSLIEFASIISRY